LSITLKRPQKETNCEKKKYNCHQFPLNESIMRIANQQRRRKRRSHHLVHKVEELVGEKGERVPALLAPAAGDHPAQINVQEGGLEPEVSPHQIPRAIVQISRQILLHGYELNGAALDPANAPLQLHRPLIHWEELSAAVSLALDC
jgi:hypothetical protein